MMHQLLNRLSYGPNTASKKRLQELGYTAFLEEQLYPDTAPIPAIKRRTKRFKFVADNYKNQSLSFYAASAEESWKLLAQDNEEQKGLPTAETFIYTCFHALYSPWQLQELLVQFWHNHFSVYTFGDPRVQVALPAYDKLMRQHSFGNFRVFLEAVAQSPAMLFYLGNASSRASPANENYARELFELHTMGRDAYQEEAYPNWKDVPRTKSGKAIAYIEDDVHEAARAFTGWTVADGDSTHIEQGKKPNTGAFMYLAGWHDDYQKRILGQEFSSHQAPLKDGRMVLDLVATHERTAYFICTKLCRYFVSDTPPPTLVARAASLWQTQSKAPDQIRQVLRLILSSEEFHASLGKKFKKPFELVLSFFRAMEADITPNLHLRWMLKQMGQMPMGWAAPDGFPDLERYWSSGNLLLERWNVMPKLLYSNWHELFDDFGQLLLDDTQSSEDLVKRCVQRLLGAKTAAIFPHHNRLVQLLLREERRPDQPPLTYNNEDRQYQSAQIWALLAMTPHFQYR